MAQNALNYGEVNVKWKPHCPCSISLIFQLLTSVDYRKSHWIKNVHHSVSPARYFDQHSRLHFSSQWSICTIEISWSGAVRNRKIQCDRILLVTCWALWLRAKIDGAERRQFERWTVVVECSFHSLSSVALLLPFILSLLRLGVLNTDYYISTSYSYKRMASPAISTTVPQYLQRMALQ